MDSPSRRFISPLRETVVNGRVVVFSTGGEVLASSWGANAVAVLGDRATLLADLLRESPATTFVPGHGAPEAGRSWRGRSTGPERPRRRRASARRIGGARRRPSRE